MPYFSDHDKKRKNEVLLYYYEEITIDTLGVGQCPMCSISCIGTIQVSSSDPVSKCVLLHWLHAISH